jgi:eukaryotic-like serine/threonine-protein kinase
VTPARWRRLKELFGAALEVAPADRDAFLAAACEGDLPLRAELEALLAAHRLPGAFLEAPPLPSPAGDPIPPGPPAPEQLGPYRLVRELGHGGMGTVYLAIRADQEFHREVAIKVIRRGMDTDDVVGRFRNERQILAGLAHPGIAALLDGGTTAAGQPFFVMERVEGEPIDRYCDRHRLDVSARLELFLQVCAAVQHAHGRLVVHRDLKPGNILVDAAGRPKLLDFGLARLLEPGAEQTATQLRIFTPAFASPEQIRGGPVSTATDVYSLGALLYLLLTGLRPHAEAGGDREGLARAACERDPRRPSAVVAERPAWGGDAPELLPEARCAVREGTPVRLRRRLAGDLDAIVLRAMRREPEERYPSVEALGLDLRRFLEGQPVAARRGGRAYRSRKFVARHRLALAAGAAVVLALSAATVISARERARAERRAAEVRKLAGSVLLHLNDAIAHLPGSTPLRVELARRSQESLASLAQEASGDVALQRDLAAAYLRLGNLQGSWGAGQGDVAVATGNLRAAATILEGVLRTRPDELDSYTRLARALVLLSFTEGTSGTRTCLDHGRRAVALGQQAVSRFPGAPEACASLADSLHGLGQTCYLLDLNQEALGPLRQAVARYEELARSHPEALGDGDLAGAYDDLAKVTVVEDRAEGERLFRLALAINQARVARRPTDVVARHELAFSHVGLARALKMGGAPEAAREQHSRALSLREAIAAEDPGNAAARMYVAETHWEIGALEVETGQPARALGPLEEAARAFEALLVADPENTYQRASLAEICFLLASTEEALAPQAGAGRGARLHWQAAQQWGHRSAALSEELARQGKLTPPNEQVAAQDRALLERCEAALAGEGGAAGQPGRSRASSSGGT